MSTFSPSGKRVDKLKPKEEPFVAGYLGRINRDKGIDIFVETIDRLRSLGLNVVGEIAGMQDGDVDTVFPFFIRRLGEVTRQEACDFLRSCDIFLFPSRREGFGLAVAEASAVGVPIVAFDIVGIRDVVVDCKTGFLVTPGKVDELVDKVKELCMSSEVRLEFGMRGREHIQKCYSQEMVLNDFMKFYKELV